MGAGNRLLEEDDPNNIKWKVLLYSQAMDLSTRLMSSPGLQIKIIFI